MPKKTYEEELESIERSIARAKTKKQRLIHRHSEMERKARTHALCTIGGLIVSVCYPGGWTTVDLVGLATVLVKNADLIGAKSVEPLPTPEAKERLDSWKRELEENVGLKIDSES